MSVPTWLARPVAEAMAARQPTGSQRALLGLLAALESAYGAVVRARNAGYAAGLLPVRRLPCRVISVGNLTVGGTGKTPAVLCLARALTGAGVRVAILLRGYGRRTEGRVRVVSDGRGGCLGWREAGDEALLLARSLPAVPVVVGADRYAAGRVALEEFRSDLLLLDDGFQHRRLHRDVDLLLLDATDPFGGERLLPRGRLREPLEGLARAHALLVTRADEDPGASGLRERLAPLAAGRPVGFAVHRPVGLVERPGGETRPLDSSRGLRVLAVSGIAKPESFARTLAALPATVVGRLEFPDHHPYGAADRAAIRRAAHDAGAEAVLTTEKDLVRMETGLAPDLPILAVRVELGLVAGAEELGTALGVPLGGGSG